MILFVCLDIILRLSSDKKSNEKLELFQNIFDIEAECPREQAKQQKESKISLNRINRFSCILSPY
jgi:hypothetical protein